LRQLSADLGRQCLVDTMMPTTNEMIRPDRRSGPPRFVSSSRRPRGPRSRRG
jgi:hypothetical protein